MRLRPLASATLAAALGLSTSFAWSGDFNSAYTVQGLVSDGASPAAHVDASLKNSWGLAFNPNGVFWVADNHTNKSTLYDGNGVKTPLSPTVPEVLLPPGTRGDASPTGIVFNSTTSFALTQGGTSAPTAFLFAGENGTIMGWAPSVDLGNAFVLYDDKTGGAIYKGIALARNGQADFLYATDFHNAKVDVFDKSFNHVAVAGKFHDPSIPRGFAPFGIAAIQGTLYVTFAKQNADRGDDVAGAGLGFVDIFDTDGNLIRQVVARGPLNAPWGIAMAPANFGAFSNRLLVGNFGDGTVAAFDAATGQFLGHLRGNNGQALKIDGLWSLVFGNGLQHQGTNTLFFTSGPGDEQHGLYGRIDPTTRSGVPYPPGRPVPLTEEDAAGN